MAQKLVSFLFFIPFFHSYLFFFETLPLSKVAISTTRSSDRLNGHTLKGMNRQEDRLIERYTSFGLTVTNTVTGRDARRYREIHRSIKEARTDGQRRQTA